MISELRVGPYAAADGAQITQRASRDSTTVTQDAHARYQEAVARGSVFTASNQAGIALSAGLVATPSGLSLYNPIASGKNCVIWDLDVAIVETVLATASAGVLFLAAGVGP